LIAITDNNFLFTIFGDITIKIYNNTMLSTKKIGRISFNTAFLKQDENIMIFQLREIDPDNLVRNKNIEKDFEIHLKFAKICDCQNTVEPVKLCSNCNMLLKDELSEWKDINSILNLYHNIDRTNAKIMLFGHFEEDDIDEVLCEGDDELEKSNII
jgi:hypothetical protein